MKTNLQIAKMITFSNVLETKIDLQDAHLDKLENKLKVFDNANK